MSYPLLPYFIGAVADAIADRRDQISRHALNESGGDQVMRKAIFDEITAEDMGHPSLSDRKTIEYASELARNKLTSWWRHGRRTVVQGELVPEDLADAPFYIRLRDFPMIETRRLGPMLMEGAFVELESVEDRMNVVVTALLSGDLDLRSRKETLANLMAHQSSIVVFTSDFENKLEMKFTGQPEIGDFRVLRQAVDELWSEVLRATVNLEAAPHPNTTHAASIKDSVGRTRHP